VKGKEILITGGTGSLGKSILEYIQKLPEDDKPKGVRIYSRDELKQSQVQAKFGHDNISYLIGDIRDRDRLRRACRGVDIIINAAAMKQVPASEYNPHEAVKTNIDGAANVIECALDCEVERVMHISTDKAVYPINLYGVTKAAAEKLMIHANNYSTPDRTRFSVCRYGNVLGSRGSVIPLFLRLKSQGRQLTITDPKMTRFFVELQDVARFIFARLDHMNGGEIFIPFMKSALILDILSRIDGQLIPKIIGLRHGEKIHEVLATEEEINYQAYLSEKGDHFVIGRELVNTRMHNEITRWFYSEIGPKFETIDDLIKPVKAMAANE